ncbi:MAG: hypothetical protein JSR75_19815 [Proteobacteria bacterium]|nr:hypothetical protein [Pseudomonadota bacterium]
MRHLNLASAGWQESGAFLLGSIDDDGGRHMASFVPYDQLDVAALHEQSVRVRTAAFSRLYDICAERGQRVVADVHAHPRSAWPSGIDKANPMLAVAGHLALIVPNYASLPVRLEQMTVNVYLGPGQWLTASGREVNKHLEIST